MLRILIQTVICVLGVVPLVAAQGPERNLLLVIADDVGVDSLSLFNSDPGASFPPTPTISALAARGIRFDKAYAYPTCSPTRAAILTGRYGYRTGVLSPASALLPDEETTLPEVLAPSMPLAGVGKWHLGGGATGPNMLGGWPHFSGSLGGGLNNYRNWTKTVNGVSTNLTMSYATRVNVTDAIDWVGDQGTNRWCLWVGFNAAHTPFHLPPPGLHSYSTLTGDAADIDANPRPYYEAMVEAMDNQIGRLLGAIDTNQTTVIFLGDNGTDSRVIQPPYDIRGRAKGSVYDGGTRVPMIIAGPDIVNPGRVSDEVVHCVDLFATMLELAGASLPAGVELDSRSLVPILEDAPFTPAEDCVLVESDNLVPGGTSGRAIRDDTYKLVRKSGSSDELYDLAVDPLESTNLLLSVLDPVEQAAYDALDAKLDAWQIAPPEIVSNGFPVVDTGQLDCYDDVGGYTIAHPAPGAAFAGQDAQYTGAHPDYMVYTNGVILDINTGLMWQQTPDLTNKSTFADALADTNTFSLGGFNDWRLPTLKELYSLIDFTGDTGSSADDAVPYIDTNYFDFVYGDTNTARYIDAQYWSATEYVGTTMNGDATVFGVNFADGRIKGYPKEFPSGGDNTAFVRYVRGNPTYGVNQFVDNGDGTVTDLATGLMWQQGDSGVTQNWEQAMAYAEGLDLAGYRDWRLPNAKELQSIVDYTRAPMVTGSAAIDTNFFTVTETESFYWTSTTHLDGAPATRGDYAVYVCFGRALGWMEQPPGGTLQLLDVHGAGAQRSDPKSGNPADYPTGHGPQGDVVRIYNYVRCVRAGAQEPGTDTDGDGLTDWYEYSYDQNITNLVPGADADSDGASNGDEQAAGTSPTDPSSFLAMAELGVTTNGVAVRWASELGATYSVEVEEDAMAGGFATVLQSDIEATPPVNEVIDTRPGTPGTGFYRVRVQTD